ncbi:hypothetical protein CERZMDRAFT_94063 [Cercospora zeae-maydis SCOH1-5]|uniref:HTH APSES-type domain-containing protein n=1 Tax=Cercospora zeae-maydis SCOH1-5 TaxID=717836 RepID=A0A6A6FQH0_9PEZI|nr:hypothetical protein CERZMDRAFT_94063 [Cercospora zeae-maydis SCOH1-5]
MSSSSYSHMQSPPVDSSTRGGLFGRHGTPSPTNYDNHRGTNATMVTIDSLLNPTGGHGYPERYRNPAPPTPAYSPYAYSQEGTPRPETPTSPSPKRQKLVKDAAMFIRNQAQGVINYPASECSEEVDCLAARQRQELAEQHLNFHVFPSGRGGDGRIEDYARRIPYSSEKKDFLNKTGRDAFDVFQYTFVVPGDLNRKEHVVMWDYRIGLVRITPFFKALKHTKTTPAKALATNAGLKDLAHSITGGALVAQGYWIPYACARALCLTFCYDIRWALTPVFGPTFIDECLKPGEPGFGSFKIDPEVVRCAAREAEGWRPDHYGPRPMPASAVSHHYCPPPPRSQPAQYIHPMPEPQARGGHICFGTDSPFAFNSHMSTGPRYAYTSPADESPALSPKSASFEYQVKPGWTSINQRHDGLHSQPRAGPVEALPNSLLMESRYDPPAPWRAAEPLSNIAERAERGAQMSSKVQGKQAVKRRHSVVEDLSDDLPDSEPEAVRSTSSESDDADLPLSPPPTRPTRSCRITRSSKKLKRGTETPRRKFTAADEQAARWLLNLSARDAQLAREPNQFSIGNRNLRGQ